MMSYMMIFGAAVVSGAIWLLLLYREFGTSQDKQRKAQASKRQKFTRAEPASDDSNRMKPRRKARAFGQR